MKKLLAAALLVAATTSIAAAADHTAPGTPGAANCAGQTMAFLAQASKNGLVDEGFRGIGGIGRWADLSTKEIKAVVDAYCAAP